MSETSDEVWESDDCVRRTVVIPTELAERLAAEAEKRGLSISDLLVEYADDGLRRGAQGPDWVSRSGQGSRLGAGGGAAYGLGAGVVDVGQLGAADAIERIRSVKPS